VGGREIPSCYTYMVDADVTVCVCICTNKCRQFPSPHLMVSSFYVANLSNYFSLILLGLPFKLDAQWHIQSLPLERRVSFESIILLNEDLSSYVDFFIVYYFERV